MKQNTQKAWGRRPVNYKRDGIRSIEIDKKKSWYRMSVIEKTVYNVD